MYTCLPVLHIGVLDKPGSKFTGIFWLYGDQVTEDPARFETSQSSVQIWGDAGEEKNKLFRADVTYSFYIKYNAEVLSKLYQQLLEGFELFCLIYPSGFHIKLGLTFQLYIKHWLCLLRQSPLCGLCRSERVVLWLTKWFIPTELLTVQFAWNCALLLVVTMYKHTP